MIVIGAGGFAKELLEALLSEKYDYNESNLFFFDNVSKNVPETFLGKYKILKTFDEVINIFSEISPEFCLGLSTPKVRYILTKQFEELGGKSISIVSTNAYVGILGTTIGDGCSIMHGALVSCDASVGKGTLLNLNCVVGHDVKIGDFVEVMPGVNITGHCEVGSYTTIGTGVVIVPKIKIGKNCSIAAGSVVTKDVPDNSLVVGILPSRVVEKLPEFEL